MPDLSYPVTFNSIQVESFYLLALGQVSRKLIQVQHFIFDHSDELACCGKNSVDPDQLAFSVYIYHLTYYFKSYLSIFRAMLSLCTLSVLWDK